MEYSYFSRIIEVQYRHVNTLITLLLSCRTFRHILRQDSLTAVINRQIKELQHRRRLYARTNN